MAKIRRYSTRLSRIRLFNYSTNCQRNWFSARKTVVVQCFARFQTNLGNLRISQDICYVRMTDNNDFLTIHGHRANLLNNKHVYVVVKFHPSYNLVLSFVNYIHFHLYHHTPVQRKISNCTKRKIWSQHIYYTEDILFCKLFWNLLVLNTCTLYHAVWFQKLVCILVNMKIILPTIMLGQLSGHLTGCGGADPHNSLTSASSASWEHFPHKTEKFVSY